MPYSLSEIFKIWLKTIEKKCFSVADLKNMIRTRIEDGKKSQAENKADTALMDKLVENAEIDLPEVLVEEEVNNQIQQLAQQISQYGMNFNQYDGQED